MILSCGEALIDFVPRPGDTLLYSPCPGGSPYNLAIAASRLGVPAGFFGKISRDFFGDMLAGRLTDENVDTSLLRRSDRLTTLAFVKVDAGEEPRYAFFAENTADRNLVQVDVPETLPENVEALAFGSISLLLEPQASTIKNLVRRESGKRVLSFDPNVRPVMVSDKHAFTAETEEMVSLAAIVKVSAADLEWLYPGQSIKDSAAAWLALGAGMVVVTLGGDGAILMSSSFTRQVPGYQVEVADTIGAGDTFHAAFLAYFQRRGMLDPHLPEQLTSEEASSSLSFAVKASALNCSREGADPPAIAEME